MTESRLKHILRKNQEKCFLDGKSSRRRGGVLMGRARRIPQDWENRIEKQVPKNR